MVSGGRCSARLPGTEHICMDLVGLHAETDPGLRVMSPDLFDDRSVESDPQRSEVTVFSVFAPDEFRRQERTGGESLPNSGPKLARIAESADYERFRPMGSQVFVDLLDEPFVPFFPSRVDQGGVQPNPDPVAHFPDGPGRTESCQRVGSPVLAPLPCLPGRQRPGDRHVGRRSRGQEGLDAGAFGPQLEFGGGEVPEQRHRRRGEPAPALQGERVGKLTRVIYGRPIGGCPSQMGGEFFEKIGPVDEQDRGPMVEISLQEAILAVEGAAIRVCNIELAWFRALPGTGEGPDAGPGVVGKDEHVALDGRAVSREGQGFAIELSMVPDFVCGTSGQGPEDALGYRGPPDPAFDIDVPWSVSDHGRHLIQTLRRGSRLAAPGRPCGKHRLPSCVTSLMIHEKDCGTKGTGPAMTNKDGKANPGAGGVDVKEWIRRLEAIHGDAGQALVFSSPLELLVALILAAQCTDERVNDVTRSLFKKYRTAEGYAESDPKALEEEIRSTGFYRRKAKAIRSCCRDIVDRFGGEVPEALEDLLSLPGVGRKTANIVIGSAFGRPAIGVDTHVKRLARRMGLSSENDPDRIEADLCRLVPQEHWVRFCHLLQFHGRRICSARKPRCDVCPGADICPKIDVRRQ